MLLLNLQISLMFCSPKDWDDVTEVLQSELGNTFFIHGWFSFPKSRHIPFCSWVSLFMM
jgi:hypothetical protein